MNATTVTCSSSPSPSNVEELHQQTPVPETVAVLTDREKFSQFSADFFVGDCPSRIPANIMLKTYLMPMLRDLHKVDPELPSRVLNRPDATLLDLKEEWVLAINDFITSKNTSRIMRLLKECLNSLEVNVGKLEGLTDQDVKFINDAIALFETGRVDLFMSDWQSWNRHTDPLSCADEFRGAVEYCRQVQNESRFLVSCTVPKLMKLAEIWGKFFSLNSGNTIDLFQPHSLSKIGALTELQQRDVFHILSTLFRNFKLKHEIYVENFKNVYKDLDHNYKAVHAKETHAIAYPSEKDAGVYDAEYVHKHRAVYENFIPRSTEFHTWITSSGDEILESSLLLRFFPLYLKFGDLNRLKVRLEEKKIYHRGEFQRILFDEVKRFSEQFRHDSGLIMKGVRLFKSDKTLALWNACFSEIHDFYHNQVLISEATLGLILPHAAECTAGLFYRPSKDKTSPVQSHRHPPSVPLDDVNAVPSSHHPVEAQKGTFEEKTEASAETEISTDGIFQGIKENTARCLSMVKTECNGFETEKALNNANTQIAGLLGTMKRLLDHKGEPISREQFLFLTLSMIRQGSLATEQMLSALDRESNQLENSQQLKAHLTHDLVQILYSCKFNNGDLHHIYRQWIHDINYGEILERDLLECSIRGNFVEKLLAKVRYFSQGEVFELKDILPDLLTYFKGVGLVCFELQTPIEETKTTADKKHAERVKALKNDFLELCTTVKKELAQLKIAEQAERSPPKEEAPSSSVAIAQIHEILAVFKAANPMLTIQDSLENIQNNLVLQLQEEMHYHPLLQPVDAYLHVSTVLLLNQMIAERYFYNLLDALEITYDREEIDHDLVKLVDKLGMTQRNFTNDEWAFLSRSKGTRLLTRYPATCDAAWKKRMAPPLRSLATLVGDAMSIAQKERFQAPYSLEEGFEIGDKGLLKKINQFKALVDTDIALLASIMKTVEKAVNQTQAI